MYLFQQLILPYILTEQNKSPINDTAQGSKTEINSFKSSTRYQLFVSKTKHDRKTKDSHYKKYCSQTTVERLASLVASYGLGRLPLAYRKGPGLSAASGGGGGRARWVTGATPYRG